MTFSIMTFITMTFSILIFSIKTFSMITFSVIIYSIITFGKRTFSRMTMSAGTKFTLLLSRYTRWYMKIENKHFVVNAAFLFFETSKLWALTMYTL